MQSKLLLGYTFKLQFQATHKMWTLWRTKWRTHGVRRLVQKVLTCIGQKVTEGLHRLDYALPGTTSFGPRSFGSSGPTAWNDMPAHLRTLDHSMRQVTRTVIYR